MPSLTSTAIEHPVREPMQPLPGRLAVLDAMRGLALFGMILVHFHQGFRLTTPDIALWPGESLSEWVIWIGVERKSAATFALLFGIGFAILLRRLVAHGRPVVAFYLRRLLALAAIGVAVEALTGYAILIELALWGVPLLLVRSWPTRALVLLAIAAAVAGSLISLASGVHEWLSGASAPEMRNALRTAPASYGQEVALRLADMQARYWRWKTLIPGSTFALYLVGLLAVRHGVLDFTRHHRRLVLAAMAVGFASWAAYWLVLPMMPEPWTAWSRHAWPIREGLGIVRDEWLAFTSAGALVLWCAMRPAILARLAPVAAVGRMALTCYVVQAAIIFALRSEFGAGLSLRPAYRLGAAVLLFATMAVASNAWLRRFRYGPLEWLWRAASRLELPKARATPLTAASSGVS